MILDERTEFCDADTLTTTTGTNNEGDVIDSTVARDLGNGQPVYVVFQVDTAVTSGGAATVAFQIASDSTTALSTDGTQTIHFTSRAVPKADLVAGFTMVVPLPLEDLDYERYLGVQAVVGTAALTAGAINAFLTLDPHGWQSYPDATN